ncbi:MAG: DUF3795 domain-containing protein [Clostridia bacterium]|nr:DUF3795 domain-containing protein [Clostridia bacterium]
MKNSIAYCGLDCRKCPAYIAAANDDDAIREKTAKLWSELNGVTITPDQINCDGCREAGRKTVFCESMCAVRRCARERELFSCGSCGEMGTCPKLGAITEHSPETLTNLKAISRCAADAILLNGPSSAGKSTLARAIAAALRGRRECAVISLDDHMLIEPWEQIWEDDVFDAVPTMSAETEKALEAGKLAIIDHVITSERIWDAAMSSLGGRRCLKVLVSCDPEVLRERERSRGNRFPGSAEDSLKYLYPKEGYDLAVDAGKTSPEDIAEEIVRHVFE